MKRRPVLIKLNAPRGRRGSALLIVLALLSLLALMAATLAYTSKLDVISSENFGDGVQRNMSAVSGIAKAAADAQAALPKDAVGQLTIAYGMKTDRTSRDTSTGLNTATSQFRFADLSGRLNVNSSSEAELATLFSAVADRTGQSIDAEGLAAEIVDYRLGRDKAPGVRGIDDDAAASIEPSAAGEQAGTMLGSTRQTSGQGISPASKTQGSYSVVGARIRVPGSSSTAKSAASRLASSCLGDLSKRTGILSGLLESQDDPQEYVADVRYPAFGDDRRFQTVGQLAGIKGMTPQFYNAIAPYLTVFSVTNMIRPAGVDQKNGEETASTIDLNRASAEDIYNALLEEYGTAKDDALLRQFAANIVDARDSDNIPTVLEGNSLEPTLGMERVPLITEVYANSLSDDDMGDDGQYIEIYNPWSEDISVSGWELEVGGARTRLAGTIGSNSYLIVTDDYDNGQDAGSEDELAGTGSFYDIFGAVANGSSKRVLEDPILSVPHRPGHYQVELYDASGDLMDFFEYRVDQQLGTSTAFQRPNILLRELVLRTATPFALLNESAPTDYVADRLFDGPRDLPFTSVLELFEVFAGYAQPDGSEGNRWGFPLLGSPDSTSADRRDLAGDPTLIDARIVDLFSIEAKARRSAETASADSGSKLPELWTNGFPTSMLSPNAERTGGLAVSSSDRKAANAIAWARYAAPTQGQVVGKVNINTATAPVLEAIGFSQLAADTLVRERSAMEQKSLVSGKDGGVLYERLSSVLVDESLWADKTDTCQVLKDFLPVFDRVAVNSRAFLLEGTPLQSNDADPKVSSGARVEALVAMDGESPEIVSWRFIH